MITRGTRDGCSADSFFIGGMSPDGLHGVVCEDCGNVHLKLPASVVSDIFAALAEVDDRWRSLGDAAAVVGKLNSRRSKK
jgi:hypothetical protein